VGKLKKEKAITLGNRRKAFGGFAQEKSTMGRLFQGEKLLTNQNRMGGHWSGEVKSGKNPTRFRSMLEGDIRVLETPGLKRNCWAGRLCGKILSTTATLGKAICSKGVAEGAFKPTSSGFGQGFQKEGFTTATKG